MVRLPDIPIASWLADQQQRFAEATAGYFPALEFEDGAKQAESIIPPDYPMVGGQDQWQEAERKRIEDDLRRQQQEDEQRQAEQARQQAEQAQQAQQEAQAQQDAQAQSMARDLGIPTPDEAFSDLSQRPADHLSSTGIFDSAGQALGSAAQQFTDWAQQYTPQWSGSRTYADSVREAASGARPVTPPPDQPSTTGIFDTLGSAGETLGNMASGAGRAVYEGGKAAVEEWQQPEVLAGTDLPAETLGPQVRAAGVLNRARQAAVQSAARDISGGLGASAEEGSGLDVTLPEQIPIYGGQRFAPSQQDVAAGIAEQATDPTWYLAPETDIGYQLGHAGLGLARRGLGNLSERLGTGLAANAERMGAADARMAERGSTQLPGTLGVITGNPLEANTAARSRVVPPHVADTLDFPVRVPTDPAVIRAIEAAGGSVDPERGVNLHVIHMQGPEAAGQTATRSSTFHIAGPPDTSSPYAVGDNGGKGVGGSQRIEGWTRYRSPLVLSDAPGSNAGFDSGMQQLGADKHPSVTAAERVAQQAEQADKAASDRRHAMLQQWYDDNPGWQSSDEFWRSPEGSRAWQEAEAAARAHGAARESLQAAQEAHPIVTADNVDRGIREARRSGPPGSPARAQALKDLVTRYGGDPAPIDDLLSLRGADVAESAWAIKENILAHNARAKGYDGVLTVQIDSTPPWDYVKSHPDVKTAQEAADAAHAKGQALYQMIRDAAARWHGLEHGPNATPMDDPHIRMLQEQARAAEAERMAALAQLRAGMKKAQDEYVPSAKITELADFRESHNPTPGKPHAAEQARVRYEQLQKDAFDSQGQRGIEDPETKRLWAEAEQAYAEYEQHGGPYGAPYNPSAPGYTLRSDLPRRPGAPDVPSSTIAENPRVAAVEREYQEALAEHGRFYEQYMRETPGEPLGSFRIWATRTGNQAALDADARLTKATYAYDRLGMSNEPKFVTANASAGTMAPAAATDRLGSVNRVLGQGLVSSVSGGVGAQINQQANPDDPYAGIKGFAVGALAPPLIVHGAGRLARAFGREAGAEGGHEGGALATLGVLPDAGPEAAGRRATAPSSALPPPASHLAETRADAEKIRAERRSVASGAYKRKPDGEDVRQIITASDRLAGKVTNRHAELAAVRRHVENLTHRKLDPQDQVDLLAMNYPGNEDVTQAVIDRVVKPEMSKLVRNKQVDDLEELEIYLEQRDNADMDAAVRHSQQQQELGKPIEGKPALLQTRREGEAQLERQRSQNQLRLARRELIGAEAEHQQLLAEMQRMGEQTHGVETDYQAFQRGFRGYGPPRRMETPRTEAAKARFDANLVRRQQAQENLTNVQAAVAKSAEESRIRRGDAQMQRAEVRAAEAGSNRKYSGGATPQAIQNIEDDLQARVGPERFQRIDDARKALYDLRDMMRERLLESEVWDQETHDLMKNNFPNYSPSRILKHMDESHLQDGLKLGQRSFSVADNGIKALTKGGTEAERMSPVESTLQMGFQAEKLAQRNAIMRKLADWVDLPGMDAVVRPLSSDDAKQVPDGFQRMSFMLDGKKQNLAIADELIPALQLGQAGIGGVAGSVLRAAKTPLEMGATRGRPGFVLTNTLNDSIWALTKFALESKGGPAGVGGLINPVNRIRDMTDLYRGYHTAFKELPRAAKMAVGAAAGGTEEGLRNDRENDPNYWYKVAAGAGAGALLGGSRLSNLSKNEAAMIQRFRESGASIGSRNRFSSTGDQVRELLGEHPIIRTVDSVEGMRNLLRWDRARQLGDILGLAWTRPLGVVSGAAEFGPRYAAFQRAEREIGDSLGQRMRAAQDAAKQAGQKFTEADAERIRQAYVQDHARPDVVRAAREITADFDKGGRFTKKANDLLPFLNAATQATAEGGSTIWRNKAKAAVLASTLVGGLVGLDAWNRHISPEDYDNVSRYTRNTGAFLLSDQDPEPGGKRGLVYIPLRGWLGALVPTVRAAMDQYYGTDHRTWPQIAATVAGATIGNLSPVNADYTALGNLATPVGSTILQAASNRDWFRDQPIVSRSKEGLPITEQFDPRTSLTARQLSRVDIPGLGNVSPMKWDWFLRNVSPGPADALLGSTDAILRGTGQALPEVETNVPQGARDLPITGSILGRVLRTTGTEQENRAYELADEIANQHRNTAVAMVQTSSAYQNATPAERERMLRSAESALVEQSQELAGVNDLKQPKDFGLPPRFYGVPSGSRLEGEVASALSKSARDRTVREQVLASQYKSLQNPLWQIATKQQQTSQTLLRKQVTSEVRGS